MASLTARPAILRPGTANTFKEMLGDGAGLELNRLNDTIKVKEAVVSEQMREISTLKSSLAAAQKALLTKQSQVDGANERAQQALGGATANSKELSMIKVDKKKLEGQVSDLMRANAKLKEQLIKAAEKNPNLSHQLAGLQSDVRAAKMGANATNDELKAVNNLVRAKDKELERMAKTVEEAEAVKVVNGELENRVRDLSRELEASKEEVKTLDQVARVREAGAAKAYKDLEATKEAMAAGNAAHADTTARLKAMSNRCSELDLEVSRLRDENARLGAVASRVAAAEVKNGSKDEGTVPLLQHLEELKYWGGEVNRLKDKVASLEKQLSVADGLKDRYRTQAERLSTGGGSIGGGSIGGGSIGAGGISLGGGRSSLGGGGVSGTTAGGNRSVGGGGSAAAAGANRSVGGGGVAAAANKSTGAAGRSVGGGGDNQTPPRVPLSSGNRVQRASMGSAGGGAAAMLRSSTPDAKILSPRARAQAASLLDTIKPSPSPDKRRPATAPVAALNTTKVTSPAPDTHMEVEEENTTTSDVVVVEAPPAVTSAAAEDTKTSSDMMMEMEEDNKTSADVTEVTADKDAAAEAAGEGSSDVAGDKSGPAEAVAAAAEKNVRVTRARAAGGLAAITRKQAGAGGAAAGAGGAGANTRARRSTAAAVADNSDTAAVADVDS